MIRKFPYLDKKTTKKVIKWLKSEEALCKAEAFRYKACHNTDEEQKALYGASTFASIIIHLEYHMEEK
tara:strand:+ start:409 stop:612 length:204 start_codon:yes stop_codon:yes gene_type:complete